MLTTLNPRPGPALLPTSVVGSYALPSWVWTAMEAIREGKYGQTDVRETFDDAVNIAIRDQERAGIDIITDGEMRRWYFVQGFYDLFTGLEQIPPLRTQGVYGYDSPPRYRVTDKISCPNGLGIVGEWQYTRHQTDRAIKMTCPGPLTLTIHMQLRKGDAYNGDRLALAHEVAVPARDLDDEVLTPVGASLTGQARARADSGRAIQHVLLGLLSFAAGREPLANDYMAGGAGADPSAGVIDFDVVGQGNVQNASGFPVTASLRVQRIDFDDSGLELVFVLGASNQESDRIGFARGVHA
jgi:hypothetical protein